MKSSPSFRAGAVRAVLAYTSAASAYLYNTTINTQYGAVQGIPALNATCCSYLDGWESVTVWKGIPFAANTGGANRWKAPQPRDAWNGTLVADSFGSACPAGTAPYGGADTVYDEDCLNLNIWSSANSTAEKRPVMIWSYPAGANGAWSMFDGGGMALQDIVVVTYNYRTGPYGWLALPELYEESGNVTTGNYGILDQVAALKWVHENIADFGGDPDRITTVGQSAGSAAVYHTVNSPLAKGLIVGAIAESGIRDPRDPASTSLAEGYNNMSTSIALSKELMGYLNVSTLAELRQVSAYDINANSGFTSFSNWRGTLDGYALPMTYMEQLQRGPANDVPLITGNTKDESGAGYGTNTTVAQWTETLTETYGDLASDFAAAYPATNGTEASMNTNLLARDISLVGSWNFANYWAQSAASPMYTYYWDHAPPGQTRGAYHMSEITYIFNNLYGTDLPWEAVDYDIAATLNAYWANFIKTQNPNTGGSSTNGSLAYWAPSSSESRTTFHLAPARPANANGLPYGYEQVPVATDERVELLLEYFNSRNASTL
ncbi:carboxylesterase [Diplodia corticola]|uniref:Carboxylesterase n=1 Tax=Diplodia corticola TaxID=236234 RepID=A0A1J9RHZ5_9PEZI|nr:carboxylesterase [Diplodia corticola]OJD32179.1 carboxylesterase [Diplodia corticola]